MGGIATVEAAAPQAREGGPRPSRSLRDSLTLSRLVLILGFATLAVPTLIALGQKSWSTEAGAHGPIVLATGLWLLYNDGAIVRQGRRQPLLPWALPLLVLLPVYALGRITDVLAFESLALWGVLVTLGVLELGPRVMRRLWFPFVYLLFLVTPPENYLFVATRPIKIWLSQVVVDVLASFGYAVGRTGVIIQVDGYQLLVATACSGVNSLIGICAISLFYVYLRHGSMPRYALMLTALLLPVAVFANALRIALLVLVTHYFGEAAGQGVFHEVAGLGIFMLSLVILVALDAVLLPMVKRMEARRARA